MKNADKRTQILHAAERLFTGRRFHEVTLDEVARAAHVGKGTIYLYFTDKDDLFFQTATEGFDALCERLRLDLASDEPFGEQLPRACERIGAYFSQRHRLIRTINEGGGGAVWGAGGPRERWREKRKQLHAAVTAVLERGAAEGRLRDDLAPGVLAHFLLGMLRTRFRDLEDDRTDNGDAPAIARVLDLFVRGAAGETATARSHRNGNGAAKRAVAAAPGLPGVRA